MAIRKVREEGDEILKKKSKEVEVIDDKIKQLIEDMVETMHAYDGVGLAAVQVGILKRILVIDLYDGSPIVKLINPVILKQKGEQEVDEGCLSFPNKYVKVKRPMEVTVEGLNENGEKIKQLIEDMVETMHAYDGVGLAAVQVGILKRILVIDLYDGSPVIKLINPVITKQKGKQEVDEGCLSFPNKYVKVERPMEVTVEGLNENGEKIKINGKELLAQAISHEVDHLNGIVLTDVMIPGSMEYITPDNKNTDNKKKRGK